MSAVLWASFLAKNHALSKIIVESSAKNQVMDNNDRSIEEAMDSLDQIFHHMHFLMLGLLRLQFYLNRAQEAGEHGKGGKDGKGKGKTNGGKGKGKTKGSDDGKGHKGDGKGASRHLRFKTFGDRS